MEEYGSMLSLKKQSSLLPSLKPPCAEFHLQNR